MISRLPGELVPLRYFDQFADPDSHTTPSPRPSTPLRYAAPLYPPFGPARDPKEKSSLKYMADGLPDERSLSNANPQIKRGNMIQAWAKEQAVEDLDKQKAVAEARRKRQQHKCVVSHGGLFTGSGYRLDPGGGQAK